MTVPARARSTDSSLDRRLAIAGLGLTLAFESHVREAIERGELVSVLGEFCAPFSGYFLHYPQRRQASRVLRAAGRPPAAVAAGGAASAARTSGTDRR